MELNGTFVFIFIFLGVFAVLIAFMPSDFLIYQTDYIMPTTQDQEVVSYFDANNITVYTYTWSFDIYYPDGYAYNQSGLENGHRIEVFWKNVAGILPYEVLEFRHAYPSPLGDWWLFFNRMKVQEPYLTKMGEMENPDPNYLGYRIDKTQLIRLSSNDNSSYFIVSDGTITQNFIVLNPGSYANLSDAWNAGHLHVLSSFEIDFDAMKPSAWTLLTQVLTFQNPDLGIPGDAGAIISYIIGAGIWAAIILLIFAAVTAVVPTIPGWKG
jgi:hypothetical protein